MFSRRYADASRYDISLLLAAVYDDFQHMRHEKAILRGAIFLMPLAALMMLFTAAAYDEEERRFRHYTLYAVYCAIIENINNSAPLMHSRVAAMLRYAATSDTPGCYKAEAC